MMHKTIPLFLLSLNMSLIFPSTPLPLGLIIIMTAFNITILISFLSSSWLSLTIFIIYIGSLLVLFAYFLSIQPNQIFTLSKLLMKWALITPILYKTMNMSTTTMSFSNPLLSLPPIMALPNLPLVSAIVTLLLLILIVIASLSFENKSTLRPFK